MKRYGLVCVAAAITIFTALQVCSQDTQAPKPKSEFAESRAKLLGTIPPTQSGAFEATPNAQGDYVYEATSGKSLVDGVPMTLAPDTPIKGLTTIAGGRRVAEGTPRLNGVYWRLKGVKAAKYWVGVVFQTGANGNGVEGPPESIGMFDIYLNGRDVPCSTHSDPVQLAPGVWFAEAQSAGAEDLKEGDELSVVANGALLLAPVARLILHEKEPVRGAHRLRINPGPNIWNQPTSLGISADGTFVALPGKNMYPCLPLRGFRIQEWMDSPADLPRTPDGKAVAKCYLANPLPVPVEMDYVCVVKGYYLQEAGRDAARLTLAPHAFVTRDMPFEITDDDPAYSITTTLKAVKRPDPRPPVGADLGWPAYDELAFFPGVRNLVPWFDPFSFFDHRRLIFKQAAKDEHQRLALFSPWWEAALTEDLNPPMPPPAGTTFKPCEVPWSLPNSAQHANSAYLRCKFALPEGASERVAKLVVETVTDEATAYINGKRIGTVRGAGAPLIGEATAALHPGQNELVLVVRGLAAVTSSQYVNPKKDPPADGCAHLDAQGDCNQKLAVGDNWSGFAGVWLEMSPATAADAVKVETSVRKKSLGAKFTLRNSGKGDANLRVKITVRDARRPVLTVGEQELTIKAGESKPLEFSKEWPNPRLWSWEQPNLYVLAVEVTDAKTGKQLDLARERFGFRETWLEGGQLFFNGLPVRLKCAGCYPPPSIDILRKCDIQVTRGAHDPDFGDETGLMSSQLVTELVNTGSKYNVESDAFWENTRAGAQDVVRRGWNHPSIIAWDLSNEWYGYAAYTGCDMKQAAERFKSVANVVEKLDPTRWTFFNGDFDIGGLHNTLSTHYMLEGARPGIVGGAYGFNGHSPYFPDGAYYRPLDRDFLPNEELKISAYQDVRYRLGSKALLDSEDLWRVGGALTPGLAKYVGEEAVLAGCVIDSASMVWRWKQDFDGQRDIGMILHSDHDMAPGTVTRAHMIQTFFMPDVAHHGFAGQKLTKAYSLLNDQFTSAKFAFKWALVGPDGKSVADGAENRDMTTGQTPRGSISFTLPAVTQRTMYTLQLRLEADGKFVSGEDRDIDVWPDAAIPAGELARKVMLFDPKGDTAKAMKEAGVTFETTKTLAVPAGDASAWVFIIGEGTLDEKTAMQAAALGKFVDDGGRVVVLAQSVLPQGLPASTMLESREWVSQPYVRLPIHPLLNGFTSWDLHFWTADRVSARGAYSKPDSGAVVPLVDSGRETGLEWVELMEMYRGKGLYVLCQLSLVEKYGTEPMARELLARVLRYAGGKEAFRSPTARLRLADHKDTPVERRMKDLGVACDLVAPDADLDRNSPTMLQGGAAPAAGKLAAWKASLSDGATLVVAGATAEDAAWLSDLAGTSVRVTVPRYRMWEGRGYRNEFDLLTAGLSHLDMFWKRYEFLYITSEDPTCVIEQFQNASVDVAGGRELVFPGALVEVKVGKGRLVIDERRWTTMNDKLSTMADRNLSALVLGLNVGIAPVTPPRPLPADVSYRPIDLTPYATRSLTDEVAEDSKGGWSDQGPDADLRDLPAGKQDFHGVPFTIGSGAKGIVVLASEARPDKQGLPWETTIPIGRNIEGLYFIDGLAYGGGDGQVILYQVQYADGSSADIPIIGGKSIRDWANKDNGAFTHERGTKTVAAWVGKCKMFSPIAVYMTLWVNPQPEKAVTAVRFVTPTRGPVVGLFALTAVVGKDAKEAPPELAKAQEFFKQAQQSIQAGKTDDAKVLLKKAIAASPDMSAAYQALADLCERTQKEDEALDVYRQWTRAGARTPLPWNRLGEILERRKDYKSALEAYTQSLKVEWNQPPALEAKARLEKLVQP
jgi:hypothetical protein